MVVWVFAGGGEAEVKGFFGHFLPKHFPECFFERKTPLRQKKGKPRYNRTTGKYEGKPEFSYGRTGSSLRDQIKKVLQSNLSDPDNQAHCDLILVLDDLDCRDRESEEKLFLETIDSVEAAIDIKRLIGFASPELEVWLIADWENSFAKHVGFRGCHKKMREWLIREAHVVFKSPESYSVYDAERDSCEEKLSENMQQAVKLFCGRDFSKNTDTSILLGMIDPRTVSSKCPVFRKFYSDLSASCVNFKLKK